MSQFQEIINQETPVLIDFFASWCGPCKMMPPILKEVKTELKAGIRILKIDVDKNPSLAQKYRVQGVPTLALFQQGELKWRRSGVIPSSEIIRQVKLIGN